MSGITVLNIFKSLIKRVHFLRCFIVIYFGYKPQPNISSDLLLCFVLLHSRATAMTRASVVRRRLFVRTTRFLGKCQTD